jgi:hypothetical protein
MPQRPAYPYDFLKADARARCVVPFEPFTECGGCCGTSGGFPPSCYSNLPEEYSGQRLSSVGITRNVWVNWVLDYYTNVTPNSNQCCHNFFEITLWLLGMGWICCFCGASCSTFHNSAREWLERVNTTLEPKGGYAKFQTIGVYQQTGKGGMIYNYTYFVIALNPTEADKLRDEPVRMMGNTYQCFAGCDSNAMV